MELFRNNDLQKIFNSKYQSVFLISTFCIFSWIFSSHGKKLDCICIENFSLIWGLLAATWEVWSVHAHHVQQVLGK